MSRSTPLFLAALALSTGCAGQSETPLGPDLAKGGNPPPPPPIEVPVSWTGPDWSFANGVCGTSAVLFTGDGASGDAVLNPGTTCPLLTIDIPGVGTRTVTFINARDSWSIAAGATVTRDLSLDVPQGPSKSDLCGKLRWFIANGEGATVTRSADGNSWTVVTGTAAHCYRYTRSGYVPAAGVSGVSFNATIAILP